DPAGNRRALPKRRSCHGSGSGADLGSLSRRMLGSAAHGGDRRRSRPVVGGARSAAPRWSDARGDGKRAGEDPRGRGLCELRRCNCIARSRTRLGLPRRLRHSIERYDGLMTPDLLVLYEDDAWRSLWPLSATRPVWDLRLGVRCLWEKTRDIWKPSAVA